MTAPHRLAVVIPAHDEAGRLPWVLDRLSAVEGSPAPWVIVVDDGSDDGTGEVATAAGATVLRHAERKGKGAALLAGCDHAVGAGATAVVTMDGDGQHDPGELPALVRPVLEESADLVLGFRRFSGEMPLLFRFGNALLNVAFRALFGLRVADGQCGFRAFSARAYSKIRWRSKGYGVESEMLVRMVKARLAYREVSVSTRYPDRYKGTGPIDGLVILARLAGWRIRLR